MKPSTKNYRDEAKPPIKKRSLPLHFPSITISLIALAVIMAAAASIVFMSKRSKEPDITNAFIDSKIEAVSDLISAKMVYNGLIRYSDNKIPYINEEAFSMIYRAEVTAGIDLSKVETKISKKEVVITIPEAEIKSVHIDENSIQFYDRKFALFKDDSKEDAVQALEQAKQDVKENGNMDKLQQKAEKQAEKILKVLLEGNIGHKKLVIRHKENG